MLAGGERDRTIAESAFASLTAEQLLTGVVRSPELASLVIAQKPELLAAPGFWSARSIASDAAFALLSQRPDLASSAVAAMMEGARDDLAGKAIAAFGAPAVVRVLAARWQIRESKVAEGCVRRHRCDRGILRHGSFGTRRNARRRSPNHIARRSA